MSEATIIGIDFDPALKKWTGSGRHAFHVGR